MENSDSNKNLTPVHFEASMVLAGVGDCLAYNNGDWEFNQNGVAIHSQLNQIGGIASLSGKYPDRIVSDDTVMLIATAKGLMEYANEKKNIEVVDEMLTWIGKFYVESLKDMNGRAPGFTCINGVNQMRLTESKGYRIPFNDRAGGCGAAMRSMCLGLVYSDESRLDDLIRVSVETGRMSHHYPVGFLGSFASAFFVACAVQQVETKLWGKKLVELETKIKEYLEKEKYEVAQNLDPQNWAYFWKKWHEYLKERNIDNGENPKFPENFGDPAFRDSYYKKYSYSGWSGSSGHDAPLIAYDAILYGGNIWKTVAEVGLFHGGDSDSTGVIAGAIYGALYGYGDVPEINYKGLEYFDLLVGLGRDMCELRKKYGKKPRVDN